MNESIGKLWSTLVANDADAKVLYSLGAVITLMLLRQALGWALMRKRDHQAHYQISKILSYSFYLVLFFVLGRIWFSGFKDLTTYVGLLSAGLAIALQSLIVNLAGWGFIIWRKPFSVGDRIEIGPHRGDVIDQRLFMFSLLEVGHWVDADQSTGRVVHVPNGMLFSQPLANYAQAFAYIWNELPVLLTFESDWRRAKALLEEIIAKHGPNLSSEAEQRLKKAAARFMIRYTHLNPKVYTTVKDSGVLLTIRYLCDPRRRRGSEQDLWEAILDAFALESRIDFAYPTQRLYANDREGKPATRPDVLFAEPEMGAAQESLAATD